MDPNDSNFSRLPSDATPASGQSADQPPPFAIPDHELLRPIGKGSYGTVWLARHVIGAYRAVKIVYRNSFSNSRPFERELSGIKSFEPISRSHEGFVDVLHVGIHGEDCFYYVMELGDAEGAGQPFDPANYSPKTLNKEIALRGRLPFQPCLELAIALSDALVALHKQRLAHRDIKPANIIFVNGIPKLADIGLVAGVDEKHSYVGTQGFIPPEGPGTPQADIYSLGKVLYEASTGKDRQEFPDLPTELESLTDQEGFLELNEVILQACRNDLTKRYQSAWDMHSDLLVIAKGKSVKRLKVLEKRLAYAKRTATISILALLLLAAIGYPIYRARKVAGAARQQQVGEDIAYGNRAVESGDVTGALPYFADALRLDKDNADHKSAHSLQFNSTLLQCPKLIQLWNLETEIRDGEFSPDGKTVLLSQHSGSATIFDIETGRPHPHSFSAKWGLDSAVFSPDASKVLLASEDKTAYLCDTADPYFCLRVPQHCAVLWARFDSTCQRFATAGSDTIVRVWNARAGTNQVPLFLTGHTGIVRFATFSHNGRFIVTASQDRTAIIWDANSGRPLRTLEHKNWVNYACFSPDDSKIVTACADYKARLWDAATGQRILVDMEHLDGVTSAEFSPDGRLIVTASLDGTARLWRADNSQPLYVNLVLRHSGGVTHACFSPDGSRVLTTCTDGTACVWDLAGCLAPPSPIQESFSRAGNRSLTLTNQVMRIFDTTSGKELSRSSVPAGMDFKSCGLNSNGRFVLGILSRKTNSQIQVWDALTGKTVAPALLIAHPVAGATLSDDGSKLATFDSTNAQAWDVLSGKALSHPLAHPRNVSLACFNPDGSLLATGSGTTFYIWNTTNGVAAFPPLIHPRLMPWATFSPNGKYLATCCFDNQVTKSYAQVWEAATGHAVGPKLWHGDGVLYVSFSPDSKHLVTAGEDHNAMIWEIATGRRLTQPLKHSDKVLTAVFSPDGKWILTACQDDTVRVWSAETGDPLTPSLRHIGVLKSALFLADSRRIAAVDRDGSASIWELPVTEQPVEDLKKLASLLSGDASSPSAGAGASSAEAQLTLWQQMKSLYPGVFKTSEQDNQTWHEIEAGENESEKQWSAAAFHLQQLVSVHSRDSSLTKRLAAAKTHLKKPGP